MYASSGVGVTQMTGPGVGEQSSGDKGRCGVVLVGSVTGVAIFGSESRQ